MDGAIELPHHPEQVWAALASDRMGSWIPVLDRARWTSPPPSRPGRAAPPGRPARAITLYEDFHRWDAPHRATFRVEAISAPVVSGWIEDLRLEPLPGGGRGSAGPWPSTTGCCGWSGSPAARGRS